MLSVSAKLRQTARHVRYLTSWPPKSDLTRCLTMHACLHLTNVIRREFHEKCLLEFNYETRAAILDVRKVHYSFKKTVILWNPRKHPQYFDFGISLIKQPVSCLQKEAYVFSILSQIFIVIYFVIYSRFHFHF